LPEDHPDIVRSLINIGSSYCKLSDHQKALKYLNKAYAIRKKCLLEDFPNTVNIIDKIGSTFSDLAAGTVFYLKKFLK